MASARFPYSEPAPLPARYIAVIECSDGRLAVGNLPDDRAERIALCLRLADILRATAHADAVATGHGTGALWRRYAREQFASLCAEFPPLCEEVSASER